jgi:hypothetical protein
MPTINSQRRRRRGLLPFTVAVVAAGVASLLTASPAQAGAPFLCVWVDRQYRGNGHCFDSSGGVIGSGAGTYNAVSSVRNDTNVTMCLYDSEGRSSLFLPIGPGSRYANLRLNAAQDGGNWNDRVSGIWPAPC